MVVNSGDFAPVTIDDLISGFIALQESSRAKLRTNGNRNRSAAPPGNELNKQLTTLIGRIQNSTIGLTAPSESRYVSPNQAIPGLARTTLDSLALTRDNAIFQSFKNSQAGNWDQRVAAAPAPAPHPSTFGAAALACRDAAAEEADYLQRRLEALLRVAASAIDHNINNGAGAGGVCFARAMEHECDTAALDHPASIAQAVVDFYECLGFVCGCADQDQYYYPDSTLVSVIPAGNHSDTQALLARRGAAFLAEGFRKRILAQNAALTGSTDGTCLESAVSSYAATFITNVEGARTPTFDGINGPAPAAAPAPAADAWAKVYVFLRAGALGRAADVAEHLGTTGAGVARALRELATTGKISRTTIGAIDDEHAGTPTPKALIVALLKTNPDKLPDTLTKFSRFLPTRADLLFASLFAGHTPKNTSAFADTAPTTAGAFERATVQLLTHGFETAVASLAGTAATVVDAIATVLAGLNAVSTGKLPNAALALAQPGYSPLLMKSPDNKRVLLAVDAVFARAGSVINDPIAQLVLAVALPVTSIRDTVIRDILCSCDEAGLRLIIGSTAALGQAPATRLNTNRGRGAGAGAGAGRDFNRVSPNVRLLEILGNDEAVVSSILCSAASRALNLFGRSLIAAALYEVAGAPAQALSSAMAHVADVITRTTPPRPAVIAQLTTPGDVLGPRERAATVLEAVRHQAVVAGCPVPDAAGWLKSWCQGLNALSRGDYGQAYEGLFIAGGLPGDERVLAQMNRLPGASGVLALARAAGAACVLNQYVDSLPINAANQIRGNYEVEVDKLASLARLANL